MIEFLEKNRLVYTFKQAHESEDLTGFGKLGKSECNTSYELPDPDISRLFLNYKDKVIMPRQYLRVLEKNNFRDKDDIKYITQTRLTIIAILISFFIGIFPILKIEEPNTAMMIIFFESGVFGKK